MLKSPFDYCSKDKSWISHLVFAVREDASLFPGFVVSSGLTWDWGVASLRSTYGSGSDRNALWLTHQLHKRQQHVNKNPKVFGGCAKNRKEKRRSSSSWLTDYEIIAIWSGKRFSDHLILFFLIVSIVNITVQSHYVKILSLKIIMKPNKNKRPMCTNNILYNTDNISHG